MHALVRKYTRICPIFDKASASYGKSEGEKKVFHCPLIARLKNKPTVWSSRVKHKFRNPQSNRDLCVFSSTVTGFVFLLMCLSVHTLPLWCIPQWENRSSQPSNAAQIKSKHSTNLLTCFFLWAALALLVTSGSALSGRQVWIHKEKKNIN